MKPLKYSILAAAAALPAASVLLASALGPNLVTNAAFDSDIATWKAMGNTPISWENGALRIDDNYSGTGNSYYSALQCVTGLQGGTTYTVSADAFVGLDQPEPNTRAVLYAYVYDTNDCSGSTIDGLEASGASTLAQRGSWITLSKDIALPANAQSMLLRPTAVKEPQPYGSSIPGTFTVLFDNFYVGETNWQDPNQPDPNPGIPEPEPEPEPQPEPGNEDPQPEPEPEPQEDPVVEEPAEDPAPDPKDNPKSEEPGDPEVPETPETPEYPEIPEDPQFPWEPPAPQVPDAPEAPAEPEPQQPVVDQPTHAADSTPGAPAPVDIEPTVDAPLPPDTGESLATKATSPWGALLLSIGLGLASLGAAALGASRRR